MALFQSGTWNLKPLKKVSRFSSSHDIQALLVVSIGGDDALELEIFVCDNCEIAANALVGNVLVQHLDRQPSKHKAQ